MNCNFWNIYSLFPVSVTSYDEDSFPSTLFTFIYFSRTGVSAHIGHFYSSSEQVSFTHHFVILRI